MAKPKKRPDWIACVTKTEDPKTAFCGREVLPFDFMLVDLAHAKGCIERQTRVQPCEDCMKAIEKKEQTDAKRP